MSGRDFLPLAARLATGGTEAEWRTAISRAYYAAFLVARGLLRDVGFSPPPDESAHKYAVYRLSNCGAPAIQQAGRDLDSLKRLRNRSDYDEAIAITQTQATAAVRLAELILQTLDAARQEPARTQITNAMKAYEKSVLGVVTWHP